VSVGAGCCVIDKQKSLFVAFVLYREYNVNTDLLSFELDTDKVALFIHGDEAGLRRFIAILEQLVSRPEEGKFDHEHLFSPTWGGLDLSDIGKGDEVLNHVKIYCWKGDEEQM
jgi:hypothetical protein